MTPRRDLLPHSIPAAALSLLFLFPPALASGAGFSWADAGDGSRDLVFDGRPVARYVHPKLDETSAESREQSYKPFHHIYAFDGDGFLTKGAGGQYTHHRGIFFGFSKSRYTTADGKTHQLDTWHCKPPAFQSHQEVLSESAGPDTASHSLAIGWHGQNGETFASEIRRLDFRPLDGEDPAAGLVVDFTSTLTPSVPELTLDGDPQHAGFQFRASNEVSEKSKGETIYLRPNDGRGKPGETRNWPQDKAEKDLPWKAMSFVVQGQRYSTLYLDHPANPKPAMFSERDYGRFGSYFVHTLTPDKPLTVHYRLAIKKGEFTPEEAEALSTAFASDRQPHTATR